MVASLLTSPEAWVAFLALVLSQLPPVTHILKGRKISVAVGEYFRLWHHLGNLNAQLEIRITNVGGMNVAISKIICVIQRKGDAREWILPVWGYASRQHTVDSRGVIQSFTFLGVSLKPDEYWDESIWCYAVLSKTEVDERLKLVQRAQDDLAKQQQEYPNSPLELEGSLVEKAEQIALNKLGLEPDDHRLYLATLSDSGHVLSVCAFDFVMYESNAERMRGRTELYKYGVGVVHPDFVRAPAESIKLTRVSDKEAQSSYKRLASRPL